MIQLTDEFMERLNSDPFLYEICRRAKGAGLSDIEMLQRAVLILLDIKDEAYQEKLEIARTTALPTPTLPKELVDK